MEVSRTILLCVCVGLSASLPTTQNEAPFSSFPSKASQIISINMLKSNIDIDGNQIHSPLGVSSILAVLAEGSTGDTYEEFMRVFDYPKDRVALRDSYRHILGKYHNNGFSALPSFQTWLYIYRNFSARQEYKEILKDYYYVEVKDINYEDIVVNEPTLDLESSTLTNSKDVEGFETLKHIKPDRTDDIESSTLIAKLDNEEILSTKPSKFDRLVDDKQYVEKPVILEEIKLEKEKQNIISEFERRTETIPTVEESKTEEQKETISDMSTVESFEKQVALEELKKEVEEMLIAEQEMLIETSTDHSAVAEKTKREEDLNIEENETVQLDEKLSKYYENINDVIAPAQETSDEPEKVTLPLEKLENAIDTTAKDAAGEIMIALETHLSSVRRAFGSRSLFSHDDIASGLSANSITSRKSGSKPKMLLFNGLYYRGNWATPFLEIRKSNNFFHMTQDHAMEITMMVARGTFHYVEAAHLKAKIICLPYEDKKYAMVLFVPNEIEGLPDLIKKLEPGDLEYLKKNGKEEEFELILPKFQVEETSRSEAMLKNLGIKTLFSHERADFSPMSDDKDLHVDEIVQFVSVRVDEGGSGINTLSAINTQGRNSESERLKFEVNRPFLYFIMDCEETFVLGSGKVYSPEVKDDVPVSVEVEIDESSLNQ